MTYATLDSHMMRLLDAVTMAKTAAQHFPNDRELEHGVRQMVAGTVRTLRRYAVLTQRKPIDFDGRLGSHEFIPEE